MFPETMHPLGAALRSISCCRSIVLSCLLLMSNVLISACGTTVPVDPVEPLSIEPQHRLELLGESSSTVVFGESLNVSVRYFDEAGMPVSGAQINFALVGRANDSSLQEPSVITDAVGVADAILLAGTTASVFRIRARAEGSEPVFLDVSVSDNGFGELIVKPVYEGMRPLAQYSVSLFIDTLCGDDEMTELNGDRTLMKDVDSADPLRFAALSAGVPYSVVVRGHSPSGTVLAFGCNDAVQFEADAQPEIEVLAQDLALQTEGSYTGTLKVKVPFAGDLLFERANQLLSDTESDGRLLQSALPQSTVVSVEEVERALGEWQGFTALRSELVSRLGALSQLDVTAAIHVDAERVAFQLLELRAGDADRLTEVSLLDERMRTTLDARIARGGGSLVVDLLSIGLPMSVVADALIQRGRDDVANLNVWADLAKCQTLSEVSLNACDGECVRNACRNQVQRYLDEMQVQLNQLDAVRDELSLSGDVSLRDQDGDLRVDEVSGSLLRGTWSGPESTLDDAVIGEFDGMRVQQRAN